MREAFEVPIFNPGKTVADYFEFRNQVGLDVAIEALRETVASRKATIAGIYEYAQAGRVGRDMMPYLQAIA